MLGVVLFACSGEPSEPGGNEQVGGSTSGSSASGAGTSAGASNTGGTSPSGGSSSAGATSAGGTATGGNPSGGSSAAGGQAGSSASGGAAIAGGGTSSGSAGLGSGGDAGGGGGAGGGTNGEPLCIIESFHLKVSGGVTFDRSTNAQDICAVSIGGEMKQAYVTFFVSPPEVENTMLISVLAQDVAPGQTGSFTPSIFSVLATGAIWSIDLPNAENPLKCSLKLDKSEKASGELWRVSGSVSCPTALSGIGTLGSTPLSVHDFAFSVLTDDVGAAAP